MSVPVECRLAAVSGKSEVSDKLAPGAADEHTFSVNGCSRVALKRLHYSRWEKCYARRRR